MAHPLLTRPVLARIAAACTLTPVAVVAQSPSAAVAQEPALVLSCTTSTLSYEEVEAGVTSDVACEWVEPGEWAGSMLRSTTVATHYDGGGGVTPALTVTGNCNESISFSAGDPWNNAISSTRHRACGVIKHFDEAGMGGDNLVTTGGWGIVWDLPGMSNRSSSVGYAS
ncbi:MAG TPA: hypothetical protein VEW93_01690 [Acidimicrobiales bacterium]|nr:hypothetical protein [Acidimicrobiales bacterium]